MRCSFRINTTQRDGTDWDLTTNSPVPTRFTTREFAECYSDECPCYYKDENDVDKCSRCNGPEEEL